MILLSPAAPSVAQSAECDSYGVGDVAIAFGPLGPTADSLPDIRLPSPGFAWGSAFDTADLDGDGYPELAIGWVDFAGDGSAHVDVLAGPVQDAAPPTQASVVTPYEGTLASIDYPLTVSADAACVRTDPATALAVRLAGFVFPEQRLVISSGGADTSVADLLDSDP